MMLKVNCIKWKPKPVTMDKWQDVAREEHCDYLEVQQALGRNPYNIKETILRNLQKPQPTKFWRAKGPNAMDVDTATVDAASSPKAQPRKFKRKGQLTDEQRQALRVLGACFFCRNTGHISWDCPEKRQRPGGQDRRALLVKPLVRPLPPVKNRSTEVEGEKIILTRENFRKEIMKLDEDDRASVVGDLLEQGF